MLYVKFPTIVSGAKRKLSKCGTNRMGNEPILALPEGVDDFVVNYDARSKDLEAGLEKREGDCLYVATNEGSYKGIAMAYRSRWMKLFSEYGFEAKYHLGKANVDVAPWSRKKEIVDYKCPWLPSRVGKDNKGILLSSYQASYFRVTRENELSGSNLVQETYNGDHCKQGKAGGSQIVERRGPELTWERKDQMEINVSSVVCR
ncbi:hypothetical protein Tco_0785878 [Tanacetum coccineum]